MSRFFDTIDDWFWKLPADTDERDAPLMVFPKGGPFSVEDVHGDVLFIGSKGSGKTSAAKTLYRGLLKRGFGGLVLCVKDTQFTGFLELCQECNRAEDVIVFGPKEKHVFNPLEGATVDEATSLLMDIASVLRKGEQSAVSENETYWRQQTEMALRNVLVLCQLAYGQLEIKGTWDLFAGRANTLNQVVDPTWAQTSVMAGALDRARRKGESDGEAKLAVDYFTREFPALDRQQSSVASTVTGILDPLRRPPLVELFSGRSTFTMHDLLVGRKICLIAMPALGWDDEGISPTQGKIANGILQFCFCRAAPRGQRKSNAFLISDECQQTVSDELLEKLSVLREYQVAVILLTQCLSAMDYRVGATHRAAILGNCRTRIFLRQDEAATREWAAQEIGKVTRVQPVESITWGDSPPKRGETRPLVEKYRVPPEKLASLKGGGDKNNWVVESYVLKDGKVSKELWHQKCPGKDNTVRIS